MTRVAGPADARPMITVSARADQPVRASLHMPDPAHLAEASLPLVWLAEAAAEALRAAHQRAAETEDQAQWERLHAAILHAPEAMNIELPAMTAPVDRKHQTDGSGADILPFQR